MRERPDAPLGTLIFRAGLLPAEVIENALEEGVRTGRRLGEILVERGLIKEEDLTRLLAGQKGLPFVALGEQAIDPAAPGLLEEEQAKLFCALPISFENGTPVVALADPTNDVLTRNVAEAIGRPTSFVVAARSELMETIRRVYSEPVTAPAAPATAASEAPEPVDLEPAPAPGPEAPLTQPEPSVSEAEPYPAPAEPEPYPAPAEPEPAPPPVLPAAEQPPEPAPVEKEPAATDDAPVAPVPHESNGHHPEVALEPPVAAAPPAAAPEAPSAPAAPAAPAPPEPAHEPVQEAPAPAYEAPTAPEPALRPASLRVPAPEPGEKIPAAMPEAPVATPVAPAATTRVLIRLTNGEKVPVADFPTLEGASEHARGLIRSLGESGEEWPLVNGRFLKPDTIVSVDVEPL